MELKNVIKGIKEIQRNIEFKNGFTKSKPFNYSQSIKNKMLNTKSMDDIDVAKYIGKYFSGIPMWDHPGTMINITPPADEMAIAAGSLALAYNPNLAYDKVSGSICLAEFEVSKYICDLAKWDYKKAHGIFTFGGKATNLYATKCALLNAYPDGRKKGYEPGKYFMLTSDICHVCHIEAMDWLGLGTENCISIKTPAENNYEMDLKQARQIIDTEIEKGRIFLGFNISGGSTHELAIDDIEEAYNITVEVQKKYKLNYRPHVHIDSVLGWAGLFFNDYDFKSNPLKFSDKTLKAIKIWNKKISKIKWADSIGIDFHKTGFCPYVSSLFLVKDRGKFFGLGPKKITDFDKLEHGKYAAFENSIEMSRSGVGPLAALAALKHLGIEGFQRKLGTLLDAAIYMKEKFANSKEFIVLSDNPYWIPVFVSIRPDWSPNLTVKGLEKLSLKQLNELKILNSDFANWVKEMNMEGKCPFIFTASSVYKVPKMNVGIGSLKIYPMSSLFDKKYVDVFMEQLTNALKIYKKASRVLNEEENAALDPVYRTV